ncbi:methyltransferase domain-containing protein [Cytobacillus sp. Sa5YUA1]|uniref:Methyltransferase domain-containing protein n=1 Tax=Cytobacillus stercorigallinarum TaxID=2762240 RepID=A0ABR8QSG3_9BACI|nr:methyltransferase domain-containing protein [Cytobacillus stercorigallinarum]MBD7938212.1 methyltransferase domain-containing protein [Cytobacillus stercorigallinarum]
MNKKQKRIEQITRLQSPLRCPICKEVLQVEDNSRLICSHRHSFDITKQGYINLLTHKVNSHYDKELFEARKQIITKTKLYNPLQQLIIAHIQELSQGKTIADAGCGEGSHLHMIVEKLNLTKQKYVGVGLDIAKEAVKMAAGNDDEWIWLVGDLANLPVTDHSIDVLLNILSPSNYQEFKRVLRKDGIVIKVVPRPYYLFELRSALSKNNHYDNQEILQLFKEHFHVISQNSLHYTVELSSEEKKQLVKMTPLTWSGQENTKKLFIEGDHNEITVDLEVIVGRLK